MEANQQVARPTVLVGDDEAAIRILLERKLGQAGFAVECAKSGEEVVALLRGKKHFDLLIVNRGMPPPSGLELALIARGLHPSIGIMITSAFTSSEPAGPLSRASVDEYFLKPFDTEYLAKRAKEVVERRRRAARRIDPPPGPDQEPLIAAAVPVLRPA